MKVFLALMSLPILCEWVDRLIARRTFRLRAHCTLPPLPAVAWLMQSEGRYFVNPDGSTTERVTRYLRVQLPFRSWEKHWYRSIALRQEFWCWHRLVLMKSDDWRDGGANGWRQLYEPVGDR